MTWWQADVVSWWQLLVFGILMAWWARRFLVEPILEGQRELVRAVQTLQHGCSSSEGNNPDTLAVLAAIAALLRVCDPMERRRRTSLENRLRDVSNVPFGADAETEKSLRTSEAYTAHSLEDVRPHGLIFESECMEHAWSIYRRAQRQVHRPGAPEETSQHAREFRQKLLEERLRDIKEAYSKHSAI